VESSGKRRVKGRGGVVCSVVWWGGKRQASQAVWNGRSPGGHMASSQSMPMAERQKAHGRATAMCRAGRRLEEPTVIEVDLRS